MKGNVIFDFTQKILNPFSGYSSDISTGAIGDNPVTAWTSRKNSLELRSGQEKRIFFLGAQPGDKNFLQVNGVWQNSLDKTYYHFFTVTFATTKSFEQRSHKHFIITVIII
jgi:hypothetical protein